MLIELSTSQSAAVLPLFIPLEFNLVIRSVILGNTPGWIYADDPANPGTALVWDRQDAVLIAGEASDMSAQEALRDVILDRIVPDARSRWIPELALFYTPGWERIIPGMLAELTPQVAGRYSYTLGDTRPIPPALTRPPGLSEGFELRRIDDGLLNSQLVHLEEVRGWIDSFWHTPQDFLHNGFGYCVITGDQVASWCMVVFAAGSARELGLATIPEYRGRGLATLVASACVEHGLAHQAAIHWHCWADNRPSAAIAEKLNFRLEREYKVFQLKLK